MGYLEIEFLSLGKLLQLAMYMMLLLAIEFIGRVLVRMKHMNLFWVVREHYSTGSLLIFLKKILYISLGSCVKLSNGQEAFILKDNKGFPDRPIVRVLYDLEGNRVSPYDINLLNKFDLCINNIVM